MKNKMNIRYKRSWLGVFLVVLCWGCHKPKLVDRFADRTILVYLAADNNLESYARKNITDMLKGMDESAGRVVVYMDSRKDVPVLMTMEKRGGEWGLDTLERYGEENAASPDVLRRVVDRVRKLYPASSYGLILGSHGTGWIPGNVRFPGLRMARLKAANAPLTRLFGEDANRGNGADADTGMEVEDLVRAIPEGFHFILFDACLMANVEMAYALRNKAEYIIASPTEILVDGFPYQKIMPLLWGDESELRRACREFRDYYEHHSYGGAWRSGTISLIRTEFLNDLAWQVKTVLDGKAEMVAGMTPSDVWRYPLIDYNQDVFFDLGEFVRRLASESEYKRFETVLEQAVYRLATTRFNDVDFPTDRFSGLSVYIPLSRWSSANEKYSDLEWYEYVYGK
ncbi:MAG: hypothetical protein K2I90_08655 [Odoribacter sp.]|nr:hypothetical protein [Odoribacter sp.]